MLDHLVYAVPDLDAAIEDLAGRLGVRPAVGGSHPGRGTRNALLALGPDRYLELLAPDPDQQPPPGEEWPFGATFAAGAQLVAWCVRPADFEASLVRAREAGYFLDPPAPGQRTQPDGAVLRWRIAVSGESWRGGVIPFVIDWGDSPHPAETAPGGVELVELTGTHPFPVTVRTVLDALDEPLDIRLGQADTLTATVRGPAGEVVLGP